jgi:hypothetical protein
MGVALLEGFDSVVRERGGIDVRNYFVVSGVERMSALFGRDLVADVVDFPSWRYSIDHVCLSL